MQYTKSQQKVLADVKSGSIIEVLQAGSEKSFRYVPGYGLINKRTVQALLDGGALKIVDWEKARLLPRYKLAVTS